LRVPDAKLTPDRSIADALRALLDTAGFSPAGVSSLVTEEALAAATAAEPEPEPSGALRATGGGDTLSTLVRLFLLGTEVDAAAATAAFLPLELDALAEAGVLRQRTHGVVASIGLTPLEIRGVELVVAHDLPGHSPRRDAVIGVGPSSADLAAFTIEQRSGRALDLGCGGGIQALLLAARSEQVVASDVNDRALGFCRFNAALNQAVNIELRLGDRFEPIGDDTFDLIVCNPPFVVSPDHSLLFRDAGLPLDEMARSVVRGCASHLNPLGYAQVMASWPLVRGEVWHERLRAWVEGLQCDAWVIQDERQSADGYARRWLAHGGHVDRTSYDRWLDHYEQEGIEGFGYGLVTLRRVVERAPWFRHDEVPTLHVAQPAVGIRAGFEAADWLVAHRDEEALLGARLQAAPGARLESWQRAEGGSWQSERVLLRQVDGLPFSGLVNDEVAALVARCDGMRPLREVLEELGQSDAGTALSKVLAMVRALVANSFLLPVAGGPPNEVARWQ
jgi:methylase of polypeptide subunit release factors